MLILASPGRNPLCVINGIDEQSVSFVKRSNNTHTLSFDVHKYIDGELTNGYHWVEEQMELYYDGIWFNINYPPSVAFDSYDEIKSVTAESDEIKLQQYMLTDFAINMGVAHSYEYMYKQEHDPDSDKYYQVKFYNEKEPELSLLHIILKHAAVPGWQIGYVDDITVNSSDGKTFLPDEICYFDIEEQSVYSLLTQEVATTCRCVFEFDTKNMLINAYRVESLGKDTNVLLDFQNIQNSINISRDNALVTVFDVQGDSGIDISYVNPVGDSKIIDLSYYCKEPYMSKELAEKYKAWTTLRDSSVEPYYTLTLEYHKLQDKISEITDRVPTDSAVNDWSTASVEDLQEAYNANIAIIKALENKFQGADGELDYEALKASEDWSLYESIQNYTIPAIVTALQSKKSVPNGTTDYGSGNYLKNPVPVSYGTTWQKVGDGTFSCRRLTQPPDYGMTSGAKIVSTKNAGIKQKEAKTSKDTTYCISVYVRPTTDAVVQIIHQDSSLPKTSVTHDFNVVANMWQRVYCSFKAGSELTDVTFRVKGKANVTFTGMQMELGDMPKLFSCYIYGDTELKSYETDWDLYGVDELEAKLVVYQNNVDIMTANGYSTPWSSQSSYDEIYHTQLHQKYLDYAQLLKDCQAALDERLAERKPYEEQAATINQKRAEINQKLQFENFGSSQEQYESFTENELFTINSLKNQQTYTNPNIVSTSLTTMEDIVYIEKELYDDAMDRLYVESHPQYTYSDSVDNVLALPEFAEFHGELDINNFIRIAIDDSDTYVKLRVIEITSNPFTNENDLQIVFSNMTNYRAKRDDLAYLIDNTANASSKGQIVGNTESDVTNYILTPEVITKIFSSSLFQSSLNGATVGSSGSGGNFNADKIITELVKADEGDFDKITSDTGFFKYIDTNIINSSQLFTEVATINKLLAGTIEADSGKFIYLSANTVKFDESFVTTEIASRITVADLKAGDIIVSDKVKIISENGRLIMDGQTLQITGKDSNGNEYVGIQLGYDASSTPSLILRDENGALLLTPKGITENAIADGLIKNEMVADSTLAEDKMAFSVAKANEDGTVDIRTVVKDGKDFSQIYATFYEDALKQYSKIEQNSGILKLLVTDTENTSSLELTPGAINAFTSQFIVKDQDGNAVIIEKGQIKANAITTPMLSTDAIKSSNYDYSSGNFSNAGTFLNLSDGSIISKNFAIDASGNAYFNGNGTFSGTVTSKSGTIGGWTITNNAIYNGAISMATDNTNKPGTYIFAGSGTNSGILNYNSPKQYTLLQNGKLEAFGANIKGDIVATSITANQTYSLYVNDDQKPSIIIGSDGWKDEGDGYSSKSLMIGTSLQNYGGGYDFESGTPGIQFYVNTYGSNSISLHADQIDILARTSGTAWLAASTCVADFQHLNTSGNVNCGANLNVGKNIFTSGITNVDEFDSATKGCMIGTSGTISTHGDLVIDNYKHLYSYDTNGNKRLVIMMNKKDNVQVGGTALNTGVTIYGSSISNSIQMDGDAEGGYTGGTWKVRTYTRIDTDTAAYSSRALDVTDEVIDDEVITDEDSGIQYKIKNQLVFSGNSSGYYFQVPAAYDRTTSNAANLYITKAGTLQRSTSASKYKLNIKEINEDDSYAYNFLKLSPMQWNDKSATEQYANYLSREYTKEDKKNELQTIESIESQYGLIAEHLEKAGLEKYCQYDIDDNGKKTLEGIMYDRLATLNIPISRDLVFAMQIIVPAIISMVSDEKDKEKLRTLLRRFDSVKEEDIITQ